MPRTDLYGPRPREAGAPVTGTVVHLHVEDLTTLGAMGSSSRPMFSSLFTDRAAAKAAAEAHYKAPIDWKPSSGEGTETSGDLLHVMYTIGDAPIYGTPPAPQTDPLDDAGWAAVEDVLDSVRLAMESAGIDKAAIDNTLTTATDYATNRYGDS